MWRLFKALLVLVVLAAACLVGYAYLGPVFFPADFAPPREVIRFEVVLDGETPAPPALDPPADADGEDPGE